MPRNASLCARRAPTNQIGETSSEHFRSLREVALKTGVERELEIAWARWFFLNIQN